MRLRFRRLFWRGVRFGHASGECSVEGFVDDMDGCTEPTEDFRRCCGCRAVSGINDDGEAAAAVFGELCDDCTNIEFTGVWFGCCGSEFVPGGEGELLVNHGLFQLDGPFVSHFGSVCFDDFDAVVLGRVVGCGDHDAAVEVVIEYEVLEAGGWDDVEVDDIASAGEEACTDGCGEGGAGCPGVTADADGFSRAKHGSEGFCYFEGEFRRHVDAGYAADAVGAEVLFLKFCKFHSVSFPSGVVLAGRVIINVDKRG